jgi:type I restriction-modification system DNA methylase subunit
VNLGQAKENVVITDVRFVNELVDYNFKIVGGISDSEDTHQSELGIDDVYFDLIIQNPRTNNPEKQIKSIVSNIIEVLNG